jgi:hypothetical protein
MSATTRVNPTAVTLGTLQSTLQLKIFEAVLSGSGTASALNAAGAAGFTDEMGTTGALMQWKSNGLKLTIVGDGHALNVDTIAQRLGNIVGAGTVSGGVWTFTDASTLTVTEKTSFASLQS